MYSRMSKQLGGVPWRELGRSISYLVLYLSISAPVSAQATRPDAPECATIVERFRPGGPHASLVRGLSNVAECPGEGPAALARLWRNPPADTATLNTLSNATLSVRDARVIPPVVAAVENSGLSRQVRLAALRTLVRLYAPTYDVIFKQRPGEEGRGPIYALVGQWTGPVGREGTSPVTPADRDRLLAALRQVSQSDIDPGLSRAASQLIARLEAGTH